MNIAVIFAGGSGQRFSENQDAIPKQFLKISDKPILVHTLLHFQKHSEIDKIYIAILSEYKEYTKKLIKEYNITKVKGIVDGGATGQESIYNALKLAQRENPENSVVLIHDGVRPVITKAVISNNIKSVIKNGTGITSTPCYETILVSEDGICPREVPYRNETYAAQAPQSFRLSEILEVHEIIRKSPQGYQGIVDSCTLFHALGRKTHLVRGNFGNIKITTPEDMYILRGILRFKEDEEAFGILGVNSLLDYGKKDYSDGSLT